MAPAEATACPRWLKFLEEVTGGDEELIAFLRRVAGYCLTGRTSEHALFFLLGPGRTGKSVFIEALAFAHGDYAAVASMDTFVESRGERHPTDLAMLQGARLVVASETEKDRVWAAARLKQLTGGDRVTARYMRQDFFTYSPQFKLMIAGNHPPKFAAMDEALRARIHIIPFNVFVPPAKRDKALSKALAGEAAGILRWALEGCLEWQKVGLAPPDAVQRATASFLGTIDPVSRWIEARCLREPNAKAAFADLFDDWIAWAACEGEHAGSEKQLSQSLRKRGIVPHRTPSGAAGFLGLRLKSPGSDTD